MQSTVTHIRDHNSRCQRDYILQRARDCVSYVDIYYCYMCGDRLTHHQNVSNMTISYLMISLPKNTAVNLNSNPLLDTI